MTLGRHDFGHDCGDNRNIFSFDHVDDLVGGRSVFGEYFVD